MKKRLLTVILIIVCANCFGQETVKLNDKIFVNSLEKQKLNEKVKKLIQFKFKKDSISNIQTKDTIMLRRYEFTDFGKVHYSEYYNEKGELLEKSVCKFQNNLLSNINMKNIQSKTTIEASIEYNDIINQLIYRAKVDSNSTNNVISKYTFDKYNNPIEVTTTQFNNTNTILYENHYDKNGNLILYKQITKNNDKSSEITYNNKYNKQDKLEEQTVISNNIVEYRTITEFDTINGTTKVQYFMKNQIWSETTYDKNFNEILLSKYRAGNLSKIYEYKYKEFDKNNNWTVRNVQTTEYINKENSIVFDEIEKRDIVYYN